MSYVLSSKVFLNQQGVYRDVIVINRFPSGKLSEIVRQYHFPSVSPFVASKPTCEYAIVGQDGEPMDVNKAGYLFSYLISYGYTIDTNITNMVNMGGDLKFIAFIRLA
tara:strand:+ start:2722 stop:3045 length:324 start_codon:yes stop_codon:yes gene_type:complete